MARIIQFQTNFSVGELDPLLRARTDLEQYQNGLDQAQSLSMTLAAHSLILKSFRLSIASMIAIHWSL